jgi:signal transduction histidine kinase
MTDLHPASLPLERPAESLLDRVLGTPLLGKILVADLVINIASYLVVLNAPAPWSDEIMLSALFVTLVLNAGLVYWALLPLKRIEDTALAVSQGNLAARVPPSRLADRNMTRIGQTLNTLLDNVARDRGRLRTLAAQVISAGDAERARIGRELHDSTAQSLGAIDLLLTAALCELPADAPVIERLTLVHGIVTDTLQEVRTLAHNVHPRVLDDLGLGHALEWLARVTREQGGGDVRVHVGAPARVPQDAASVLYRVAQEAIGNAVKHAGARHITLALTTEDGHATLEVRDDGRGFDPSATARTSTGMGLFSMQERVALVGGAFTLDSEVGRGTTVRATIPLVGEI